LPYCPRCNFEYRPGVVRCPDCGSALVHGTPPPPPSPRETESVRLCLVPDPTEAEIIRAALAQAGIPCVLDVFGPITGAYLARVADGATHDYAIIFVTRNRLEEARRVLREITSGPVEWPEGMEPEE